LRYAKPGRVLPLLVAQGISITPSVRSATSKLLKKAKQRFPGIVPETYTGQADKSELAMKLIESCGGDFTLVKKEIDRLEKFAKAVKKGNETK
jgi:hypothetical protein